MTTFRDYDWTADPRHGFFDYCLTLVGKSTSVGVLTDLRASTARVVGKGLDRAMRDAQALGVELNVDGVDRQLAAVTNGGNGWTLLVQMPGFIGISDDALRHLGRRHEIVGHSENINGFGQFVWWSDGEQRVTFEPLLPYTNLLGVLADRQHAPSRERIVELIGEVGGIDLSFDPDPLRIGHTIPGAFALAERLTGVRVTPELLTQSTFTVAVVSLDP